MEVPAGLDGVVVTQTAIGEVRAAEGSYHYRHRDAIDLARAGTFEDAWALLVDGEIPTGAAAAAFAQEVRAGRHLPEPVARALPLLVGADPLDGLRSAVSVLAALHPTSGLDLTAHQVRSRLLAATAALPTIAVWLHARRAGRVEHAPREDLGHAANVLWMLTGEEPAPRFVRALDAYLVVAADHGMNASTFAARVVASTGTSPVAAMVAALAAFGGRLHGATPVAALDALDAIGSPDRAEAVVRERLGAGERLMGFGHRVYRDEDPRAVFLREVAAGLDDPAVATALAMERAVAAVLPELRPGRTLRVNLELYAGALLRAVGIPRDLMVPVFASARAAGWSAHIAEQLGANRIYRPLARYVGPPVQPTRAGDGTRVQEEP